jgi:hypothetical protein
MVKKIQTEEDSGDILSGFEDENEFNNSLSKNPEVLENELDILFRETEREVQTDSGWIDILAKPYGSVSDKIVIESQIGTLNDDHISRGYKYAIEKDARVLIYVADDFSAITRQQLTRIGENDDDLFIFGFIPSITNLSSDSVRIGFTRAVSPSDWEDYQNQNFPDGVDEDRTIIFHHLEEELKKQNIAELRKKRPVPQHSGYYESEPDPFDEYDIYYSVRTHVNKAAYNGDEIGNITLNIRCDKMSDKRAERVSQHNSKIFDETFERWNVVPEWGTHGNITISKDLNPENHQKIVGWFVSQRQKLNNIKNELDLADETTS